MPLNTQTEQALIRIFDSIPVRLTPVYTVIARREKKWRTLQSKTDNLSLARRALYAAASDTRYERIVLCKAYDEPGRIDLKWLTFECAIPMAARVMPASQELSDIIERIRLVSANKNIARDLNLPKAASGERLEIGDRQRSQAAVERKREQREFANLPLTLCLFGAALNLQFWAILVCLSAVIIDILYVSRIFDRLIGRRSVGWIARRRGVIYSLVGMIMIMVGLL